MHTTIEQSYIDEIVSATSDVFRTMVFTDVHVSSPAGRETPRVGTRVVGTVAFTGKTNGLVMFSTTLEAATFITAALLGMDGSEVTDELPDAIGELTNMIAGTFRTRFAHAHNERWAISVPTVTVGSDFCTRFVSQAKRILCPFMMGEHEIFVELIVTKRSA